MDTQLWFVLDSQNTLSPPWLSQSHFTKITALEPVELCTITSRSQSQTLENSFCKHVFLLLNCDAWCQVKTKLPVQGYRYISVHIGTLIFYKKEDGYFKRKWIISGEENNFIGSIWKTLILKLIRKTPGNGCKMDTWRKKQKISFIQPQPVLSLGRLGSCLGQTSGEHSTGFERQRFWKIEVGNLGGGTLALPRVQNSLAAALHTTHNKAHHFSLFSINPRIQDHMFCTNYKKVINYYFSITYQH